jgi:hypothetical protein
MIDGEQTLHGLPTRCTEPPAFIRMRQQVLDSSTQGRWIARWNVETSWLDCDPRVFR